MRTIGDAAGPLAADQVSSFITAAVGALDLDGRSLCLVIPDATRRCPLPDLLAPILAAVSGRVTGITTVVALGTHAPMTADAIASLVGIDGLNPVNHEWWDDTTFVAVGGLDAATVGRLSNGMLEESVDVRINRHVVDSDITIIVGPVLPHEVVGFSGGNKYLFPGLSGQELIDLTHWVGALITSREIIGSRAITPVRALINAAADLVPGERHALCVVTDRETGGLHSLAFGEPQEAWAAATSVAAATHVRYLDAPVRRVLSLIPERYDDLWTGAKGFYKVEPIVTDGGDVVLYAPHITEIARMHPRLVEIGYHCRDYFLAEWDRYQDFPRGELAHSTHVYGAGTYDPTTGVERPRVRVTLATGIPEAEVHAVNLGYLDPATIDPSAWATDQATLVVPDAGEVLFRLRDEAPSR